MLFLKICQHESCGAMDCPHCIFHFKKANVLLFLLQWGIMIYKNKIDSEICI